MPLHDAGAVADHEAAVGLVRPRHLTFGVFLCGLNGIDAVRVSIYHNPFVLMISQNVENFVFMCTGGADWAGMYFHNNVGLMGAQDHSPTTQSVDLISLDVDFHEIGWSVICVKRVQASDRQDVKRLNFCGVSRVPIDERRCAKATIIMLSVKLPYFVFVPNTNVVRSGVTHTAEVLR